MLQPLPTTSKVATPAQVHLLYTGLQSTLMGERTGDDDTIFLTTDGIVVHSIVIVMTELLVGHTSFRGLKRCRQMLLTLIGLPTIHPIGKHLIELGVPPLSSLRIGEVDMLASALPPLIRLAVVHPKVLAHHLVVSSSFLLGCVLTLFIHVTREPEDGPDSLVGEALNHLGRIGITLMIPVEVVIRGTPRTVDNHSIHRNLPFEVAIHKSLSCRCGVQTILPYDMSQRPGRCDGRTRLQGRRIDL